MRKERSDPPRRLGSASSPRDTRDTAKWMQGKSILLFIKKPTTTHIHEIIKEKFTVPIKSLFTVYYEKKFLSHPLHSSTQRDSELPLCTASQRQRRVILRRWSPAAMNFTTVSLATINIKGVLPPPWESAVIVVGHAAHVPPRRLPVEYKRE